ATQPDVVITIDAPGFCFRVAKACRKHWPKGTKSAPRFIHYVAPSVWAYKPGRAKKVAALYDHVLTLLPFEPPYFDDAGMEATFVGHPLVETAEDIAPDGIMFRTRHAIPGDAPLVAALPGSRLGEVKRHLPLLREATALLIQQEPKLVMTMPVVPHLTAAVREMTQHWPCKLVVVNESTEKWNAFDAANIALAKSGTVTLELALFNTPMVVFYKVNPVSAWLIKQMLRVPYVSLINILADAHVVPELLQDDATPEALSEAALLLLHSSNAQTKACEEGLRKLGLGDAKTPSEKAAEVVLSAT
ncbi:MAG: lipid-A-disaccharide synthase, partial [Rickettsiales bacterium]